ncbi:MAG: L-2-amino-thiazoline-4-carboxylic acid hydrolase [Clostridia bacterium]|nr:L-2-amino-thiazoline-4-carboxylic acid hydrolase [Clostridia bacterium]
MQPCISTPFAIVACPYNAYFTALGCPELMKIFCTNDDRCYGSLPGLEFRRTGTLGTGANRCDFRLRAAYAKEAEQL